MLMLFFRLVMLGVLMVGVRLRGAETVADPDWHSLTNGLDLAMPKLPELPKWQKVYSVRMGGGYKDNLLLGNFQKQRSAYFQNGLEIDLFRTGVDEHQFLLFADFDDLRFPAGEQVQKEQAGFLIAQYKWRFRPEWELGLAGHHYYQDQFMDLSADALTPNSLHVLARSYVLRPSLRRDFGPVDQRGPLLSQPAKWWECEWSTTRQDYDSPLDDYWESGAKLTLGWDYRVHGKTSKKSNLSFSYELLHRQYDHMEDYDLNGVRLPGTSLESVSQRLQLAWRHYLDADARWNLQLRPGYLIRLDGGMGYTDYDRLQLVSQVQYRAGKWDLRWALKVYEYLYFNQNLGFGASETARRRKTDLAYDFRLERSLTKYVKLYAQYGFERLDANLVAEGYQVSNAGAGLIWEF